jgi:two-component system cell cycle response regulator
VLGDGAAGKALCHWLLWVAFGTAAVTSAVRAAQVPEERLPWSLMALAWSSYVAGGLVFNIGQHGSSAGFPSLPDTLWLGWYPSAIAAFALLLRRRGLVHSRGLWLDGLIGALTVASLGAVVLFPRALDGGGVLSAVYAMMDLSVIGFVMVMGAFEGWRPDRTWACVGLGVLGIAVGDSFYLVQASDGAWTPGNLVDLPYIFGAVLLIAAAWQPHRPPVQPEGVARLFTVPMVFAAAAMGLEMTELFTEMARSAHVVLTATLALIVVRLGVTFRDYTVVLATSRHEALTDAITGLGNRRRLMAELESAVASGDPVVVAIFDLDGFKHYNDAYGHAAGDALLTRLGRALGHAVQGIGTAYRLGGDEFCVLLPGNRASTAPALAVAVEALTEDGEGFAIGNSHGAVEVPAEASDSIGALKAADQQMYARKNARPTSAFRQTRDVLVGVLAEREPDLHDHVLDVGRLAAETARRLGLAEQEVSHVVAGAELHDVGKIAIPDAILHKPGPLDPQEWMFMKRHTIIGERFLLGVPALKDAAGFVRSSHEAWDGSGYPDALSGEAIPLGARIISVCDAFAAMTANRPYRGARAATAAIAELRRCAGTQFDPAVVEAFCAVAAELQAPPPSADAVATGRAA